MNLKDILAVSGEGTLFKFIAQGKNAVIVENLETGRRFSAGTTAKVSALDEISIYTTGEDIPLSKVMDLIHEKENGGEALSHKQPDTELKKYFALVLPDYDRDRVYTSDIKKVLHWYNILHNLNLLVKEEEKGEPEAGDGAGEAITEVTAGDSAEVKTVAGAEEKAGSRAKGKAGSGSGSAAGKKKKPSGSK
jgi:hypothetical protein